MRTYATRHGRGPLPHEADLGVVEVHNTTSRWAGEFRTAPWDAKVLRYTLDRVRPDVIALSHLDVFDDVLMSGESCTGDSEGRDCERRELGLLRDRKSVV